MTFQGMDRFKAQIAALTQAVDDDFAGDVADEILSISQSKVPVDTGFLRSTGRVVKINKEAEVRYDADYAVFVEFGTSRMAAVPFLRNSITQSVDSATGILVKKLKMKGLA